MGLAGPSGKEGRRGVGLVLFLVLALLGLLGFVAITRSVTTSNLAAEGQAILEGIACEELACCALAELEAQVRDGLARSGSEIQRRFAEPVPPGKPGTVDLNPYVSLKVTQGLQQLPALSGVSLESPTCRIVIQKPLDSLPYERAGVLVCRVRARTGGLKRRTARTIEQARSFKVVLPGVPRPFDRFGFFLGEASSVIRSDALNAERNRFLDQFTKFRTALEGAVSGLAGDGQKRLRELLDTSPPVDLARKGTEVILKSQPGSVYYGLVPHGTSLNLPFLDLARTLETLSDRLDAPIQALPSVTPAGLVEGGPALVQVFNFGLMTLWGLQSAFTLVAPGSKEYAEVQPVLASLEPACFRRRAHFRIEEKPGEIDATSQLIWLLSEAPLNTVILVDNVSQKLTLEGPLPGRLLLVVGKGGAELKNVVPARPGDRLALYCSGGNVTVEGTSHAHVLAGPGASVVIGAGSVLRGGLTLREIGPESSLGGRVIRDENHFSGVAGPSGEEGIPAAKFFTGLSPRLLYRKVDRQ